MKNRIANLLIATLVALLCGAGASAWLTERKDTAYAEWVQRVDNVEEPRDRVRNAVEGVLEDGVHVPPDGRSMMDEASEERLQKALAARDESAVPIRVIVWRETKGDGTYLQRPEQLQAALADEDPGILIIWEGPERGDVVVTGREGGVSFFYAGDFVGDPATTLIEALDELEVRWDDGEEFDYWGGTGGGIAAGILMGLGILLGLGTVLLVLRWISGGTLKLPGRY